MTNRQFAGNASLGASVLLVVCGIITPAPPFERLIIAALAMMMFNQAFLLWGDK